MVKENLRKSLMNNIYAQAFARFPGHDVKEITNEKNADGKNIPSER
jgi:hypothetical protein